VSLRRFLWTALLVALATMLTMWYLQKQMASRGPAPTTTRAAGLPTATAPAPAQVATSAPSIASAPATQPATTRPATSAPSIASAPATRPAATRPATSPAAPTASATAATASAPAATWTTTTAPERVVTCGSLRQADGYKLYVALTNVGAAVRIVRLADHFLTVADKHRYEKDPDAYVAGVNADPKTVGQYAVLHPVGRGAGQVLPLATRRITFQVAGGKALQVNLARARWTVGEATTDDDGTQSIPFSLTIKRNGVKLIRVEKTYRLPKNSYSILLGLRVVNLSPAEKVAFSLMQFGPTGVPLEDIQRDKRMLVHGRLSGAEVQVPREPIAKLQKGPTGLAHRRPLGRSDAAEPALWVGQANKFFASILYVSPNALADAGALPQALAAPDAKAEFFSLAAAESGTSKTHVTGVTFGEHKLAPGGDVDVAMNLFVGPKQRALFDNTPLYQGLHYRDALDFGGCWCTFTWLALAMMWLLDTFSKVLFGNYGLAIILLVVLVRIALHPLTKKGQASMARMQKLQPEMTKIREKFKDDKARQNEEMMKMYKTAGATPILGCLPMFLQMPIWIALWTGLQASVELRHAAFLPIWITDLAAPDALIPFGKVLFNFPMVGPVLSFNLLPILLSVGMALQQKFTPSPAAAGGQQAATQKQMMYFMTGFMLLIFYNAPSGLTMYIMTSTFAGVAEQVIIRKHLRDRDAAEAAAETQIAMPGKAFRGKRPKKPKGPFRTR